MRTARRYYASARKLEGLVGLKARLRALELDPAPSPEEVDAVLVACSNLQRAYPAVAIEVQHALGAGGFAYDLNVACSSATFGMQAAADAVARGHARCAVVVNPELTSAHTNFALRDYIMVDKFEPATRSTTVYASADDAKSHALLGFQSTAGEQFAVRSESNGIDTKIFALQDPRAAGIDLPQPHLFAAG